MSYAAFEPGWIPFDQRTKEQHEVHDGIVCDMPQFRVFGDAGEKPTKVLLTDVWKHPSVVAALGFEYTRIHQLTGSCVGAGGGNMGFTLAATEVVRLGDPEQIYVPFWLLPYGISRKLAGFRGRGSGSMGSTYAKAVQEYGFLKANLPGLPAFQRADGLVWSESAEYEWSDGNAIGQQWLQPASQRTVKTVSSINSADEAREAITNYYPLTCAVDNYVGRAHVDDGVAIGSFDTYGGHQTSIQGWMEHPKHGELFLYVNQWPKSVYPSDPAGGPDCSVWITKKSMDWACKSGEVYAFSQFNGYPAQTYQFRPFGS